MFLLMFLDNDPVGHSLWFPIQNEYLNEVEAWEWNVLTELGFVFLKWISLSLFVLHWDCKLWGRRFVFGGTGVELRDEQRSD